MSEENRLNAVNYGAAFLIGIISFFGFNLALAAASSLPLPNYFFLTPVAACLILPVIYLKYAKEY